MREVLYRKEVLAHKYQINGYKSQLSQRRGQIEVLQDELAYYKQQYEYEASQRLLLEDKTKIALSKEDLEEIKVKMVEQLKVIVSGTEREIVMRFQESLGVVSGNRERLLLR